ncbi:MAG: MFS transporter [Lachnospiraceae bacterium]|nr:MFS transporter [Lachnospiraceae bacterium]
MSEVTSSQKAVTRVWNPRFTCIFLANAMMYLGQYMVQTLVTTYASTLGATTQILGVVASAFALTALLFKFVSGPMLDRFERKFIIFGAMLVMAFAFLGYSFSESVTMVIAFRLLQGAAQAFTATGYLAMATDALPREKLGTGLGMFTLAQSICMAIAPTIGLAIRDRFGFPATFMTASVLVFVAAMMSLVIKPVKKEEKKKEKFRIHVGDFIAREALLPMFFLFMVYIAACLINSYLVIYATQIRGLSGIGIYFTVNSLVLLVTKPIVGRLTDRLGFVKVFVPALLCSIIAFFVISVSTSLWMFLVAAVISAFGNGVCHPVVNALCMKAVPVEKRGAGSSTSYMGVDLGNLVGPSLGAWVAGTMGYPMMWRVMTIPLMIALVVAIAMRKTIAQTEAG